VNAVDHRADGAASELHRLNDRVAALRTVLIRLLQDVVRAESRLDGNQAARLLEANERLVVTALNAQTDADTAAQELDDVARSAGIDALTGLSNRVGLQDRLAQAIANAKRHGAQVALLFLDLNGFKQINDTFGHAVGDQALQLVATRLQASVRETDTVSRHGGDEFLILLAEVFQTEDAVLVAQKVAAALAAPSHVGGHEVELAASIGISLYPGDGLDAQTLIEHADAAMYLAKDHEGGGYVVHGWQVPGGGRMPAPLSESRQRPPRYERTLAEHERRNAQLREANEHLVLAVLTAQELLAAAEHAQDRHSALARGPRK
jgi:diguanylate cyclase (GGDEF)-like protein